MLSCLSMDTTPQELISFPSDNFFYLSVCQAGMRSGHLPNCFRIWSCDHGDATTVGEEGNFREIHFYTEPSLRSSRFLSFSRLRSNKQAKKRTSKGTQKLERSGEGVWRKETQPLPLLLIFALPPSFVPFAQVLGNACYAGYNEPSPVTLSLTSLEITQAKNCYV